MSETQEWNPQLDTLADIIRDVMMTGATAAQQLESKGWRTWYREIFGRAFVDALDSEETEDRHHSQAIEWHWNTRRALIQIELETAELSEQKHQGKISDEDYATKLQELGTIQQNLLLAYFTIWARGNLKTTIARRVAVCDACLSSSAGVGGYALVVGGTKAKVRGTANSINALLTKPLSMRGSEVHRYYPKLAEVKRNKFGHSQGWTTDLIVTDANYVFHFAGLDEGMAGANEEDVRPTFLMPDDIDSRKDSPTISEHNFLTFTSEILPMRQWNTLVFYAQNLISTYSTMYRIWKQLARVLTNRVLTDPIPAVRNLITRVETVGGIVKDVYVSGQATWREWSKPGRIQAEIDTYGLPAFLRECQHEVDQSREGLVLQNWNDAIHVITKTEFAFRFGCREIPRHWNKYVVNDWARTKTKYHANVTLSLAVSAQNSALPGCYFVFNPRSFPAGAAPEDVAERVLTDITPTLKLNDGSISTWRSLITSVLQKSGLEQHRLNTMELIESRRNVLANIIPKYVASILRALNYVLFRGSHEQNKTGALAVYQRVFGLPFFPTNPGGDGGVDDINLAQRVDYGVPHPIKPGVMGYTRFFLVVDDDRADYRESLTPEELTDSDLFRYQMKHWRTRDPYLTAKGEIEGELLKMNDDYGNCLMMLFYDNCLQAALLTYEQKTEAAFPRLGQLAQQLRENKTLPSTDQMAYHVLQAQAKKLVSPTGVKQWNEAGQLIREEAPSQRCRAHRQANCELC